MINDKIIFIIIISFILFTGSLSATQAQVYPNSFNSLRDAVYMQNRSLLETMRLYTAAKQDIENLFTGADKYLALARCEYFMGITYKASDKNNEAAAFFEQGIALSEEALAIRITSEGYLLLGSGISFICEIRTSYGLRNHGKIEENARKALELDPNNLMAQHLIATFYIFAPWPVGNIKKGESLLREILDQNYLSLNRDDLFNLYLMLQAACLKQRKNQEAQMWRERGAALYPTNDFISLMVK